VTVDYVLERIDRVTAARSEALGAGEAVLVSLYDRMLESWRSLLDSLPEQREPDA
jgi:hypothetical protein